MTLQKRIARAIEPNIFHRTDPASERRQQGAMEVAARAFSACSHSWWTISPFGTLSPGQ